MIDFLLIVALAILGSIVSAVVIVLGWIGISTARDIAEARRKRLDDLAVRDAIERNRKR